MLQEDLWPAASVLASPTGKPHYVGLDGRTECGLDATGDGWWWPF